MSLTAQLCRHRTRWLCVFGFVLLLVASLGAASEEFSDLKARAEKGDAEAQANLGVMYAEGEMIPQDFSEALRWFRMAAENGHAKAQFSLGVMYQHGAGVTQDDAEATKWFRKAAGQGLAKAQSILDRKNTTGKWATHTKASGRHTGVYATIDTRSAIQTMVDLQTGTEEQKEATIKLILEAPDRISPPIFYVLAPILFKQGRKEEAFFWLNAGRLRAIYDASRCADETARGGVSVMEIQLPHEFRLAEREDRELRKRVIEKVLQWDEKTHYSYDHRWINLHGMSSYRNAFPKLDLNNRLGGRKLEELSLPEEQWPELRNKVRKDFRKILLGENKKE